MGQCWQWSQEGRPATSGMGRRRMVQWHITRGQEWKREVRERKKSPVARRRRRASRIRWRPHRPGWTKWRWRASPVK